MEGMAWQIDGSASVRGVDLESWLFDDLREALGVRASWSAGALLSARSEKSDRAGRDT
jgi:hypothetical protein